MRHGSVSELTQTLRKKGVIERLYTEPPENSVVMCLDEMGPVAAKTFAGQAVVRLPDSRQPTPMPRAIQEIDYGRRGKGYVVISKLEICRGRREFALKESRVHAKSPVSCATCRTCRQDERHIARI